MSKYIEGPPSGNGGETPCLFEQELPSLKETLDVAAGEAIIAAIKKFDGNKADAARALGIGRKTIYNLIHRLGLAPQLINPKGPRT